MRKTIGVSPTALAKVVAVVSAMGLIGCAAKVMPAPAALQCDLRIKDDRPVDPHRFTIQTPSPTVSCPTEAPVAEYVRQALCRAGVTGQGTLTAMEIRSTGTLEVWKYEGHADVQMSDGRRIRAIVNRDDPEPYNLTGWICQHALDKYLGKLEQVARYR